MTERKEEHEGEVKTPQGEAEAGAGGIRDVINRTLMLGVGAAALTADRVQAVVDELVQRGQLTAEEGREMVDDLGDRSRKQARGTAQRLEGSLQGTYKELGLATRREIEDLDFRLRQLEHRLGLLEQTQDTDTSTE